MDHPSSVTRAWLKYQAKTRKRGIEKIDMIARINPEESDFQLFLKEDPITS